MLNHLLIGLDMLLPQLYAAAAHTGNALNMYPLAVHSMMRLHVCVPHACPACCNDSAMHFISAPPPNLTEGVLYEGSRWASMLPSREKHAGTQKVSTGHSTLAEAK